MSYKEMVDNKVIKKMAKYKVSHKRAIQVFLHVTKIMHELADKEIELISLLLESFVKMFKLYNDIDKAWKEVFDYDNKLVLMATLNMNKQVFNNYLTKLRNKGVIKNNMVVPAYNPFANPLCEKLELIFSLELTDGEPSTVPA